MKKILSVFLGVCIVLSLCACGNFNLSEPTDATIADIEKNEQIEVTESITEPIEEFISETTEPSESDIVEIPYDYYLVPLHKNTITKYGTEYTNLWLVFQTTEFVDLYFLGNGSTFSIVDTKNNLDLSAMGNSYNSSIQVDYYIGNICRTDHATKAGNQAVFSDDQLLLTICISADYDINFEDLKITCTPYNKKLRPLSEYSQVLEYRGDTSNLMLHHNIIHGQTLFELDGKYYINPSVQGISSSHFGGGVGINIPFICINGTPIDLQNSLSGSVTPIYGPSSDFYVPENYDPDTMYLQPIIIPSNCEVYEDYDDAIDGRAVIANVEVGIKTCDGSKVALDSYEEKLGFSCAAMYTFEDGTTIKFIN